MICLTSRIDEKILVLSVAVLFLNFRFARFETILFLVIFFNIFKKLFYILKS